jgi:hypothetical protein
MIALGIVLVVGLIIIAATWTDLRHVRADLRKVRKARATKGLKPKKTRKTKEDESPPPALPETLEGALVRQLMTSQVTAAQYRRAMVAVAVRDAERHPVELPPDLNPPQMQ